MLAYKTQSRYRSQAIDARFVRKPEALFPIPQMDPRLRPQRWTKLEQTAV